MVEASIFRQKIYWIKCAIEGAQLLSKEALLENDFKFEMQSKLVKIMNKLEEFEQTQVDENKFFPILEDEQATVEQIRAIFYNVIKSHNPEKFDARLKDGRDYSHKLRIQFRVADHMSNKLQENLTNFFHQMILNKLQNQFDTLCDEMIEATKHEQIDIEGATKKIMSFASNADEKSIKKVLEDIKNAKDKNKHVVFKTLVDRKKALQDKINTDPEAEVKKLNSKDYAKELPKVMEKAKKYATYLSGLPNEHAKRFFLTFYSGQDKKGYDPQPLFTYLCIYLQHHFGARIVESTENYKEFNKVIDGDGSLAVELGELNGFFTEYLNFEEKTMVKLNMGKIFEGVKSQMVENKVESKEEEKVEGPNVVRLKMRVHLDFPEIVEGKEDLYAEDRSFEGILTKGTEREFVLNDGQEIRFGRGNLCDVVVPAHEGDVDEEQFAICNRGGNIYLIDQSLKALPTRIRCELNQKYRLNANDYISVGCEQDIAVTLATSHQLPIPDVTKIIPKTAKVAEKEYLNIRAVPEGISQRIEKEMKNEDNVNEEPLLNILYLNGDQQDSVMEMESTPPRTYSFGRDDSNTYQFSQPCVSRKHFNITYNKELGWLLENLSTTSYTWVHPRLQSQFVAKAEENSPPVQLNVKSEVGVIVKCFSFEFHFKAI